MKILFNWRSYWILLAFLAASCQQSDPRFSECQQFITIKQETDRQAIALSDNFQSKNQHKILAVATTFENAASKLREIQISDSNLLALQASFVEFYQQQAKATRDYITAFEAIDLKRVKSSRAKIEQLDRAELKLVEQLNNYCQPRANS